MSAAWYFSDAPLVGVARAGEVTRLCPADCALLEAAHAALGTPRSGGAGPAPPGASDDAPGVVVRSGLWEADSGALRWLTPCYSDAPPSAPPPASPARSGGSTPAASSSAPPAGPTRLWLTRCVWFADGKGADIAPLGEEAASVLEAAYVANAGAAAQPGAPVRVALTPPGAPALGLCAALTSDGNAWLVPDGLSARLGAAAASAAAQAAGLGGITAGPPPPAPGAIRLRRGFAESLAAPLGAAEEADGRAAAAGAVTHLVLTTHGVGHSLSFVDASSNAEQLREAMRRLPQPNAGRMLLLPVQWRKGLALAGDEGTLDAVLPDSSTLRPLRGVLNALVSDVLRYMTPDGQKMADSLTAALNETYRRFIQRNPGFNGPVSVVAHSLGSVLMHDLLSGSAAAAAAPASATAAAAAAASASASAPSAADDAASYAHENAMLRAALASSAAALRCADLAAAASAASAPVPRAPLAFVVDTLVLLGSPLGMFLALRGGDAAAASGAPRLAPLRCRRVANVMHPYDPISYRIEPLAWPAVAAPGASGGPPARPAEVPYAKGGRRLHAELSDRAEKLSSSLRDASNATFALSGAFRGRLAAAAASFTGALPASEPATSEAADSATSVTEAADARARALLARLAGGVPGPDEPPRLDYQLQCADLNPFLSALTAHVAYWTDADTALFISKACGPQLPPPAA